MGTTDTIQIIGIVAASAIAIWALVRTNRTAKKLASKEHELAEGLKSDILELLAIFSSIRYKRKLQPHLPNDVSIENEIAALTKNRLSAGYIYLLNCIQDKDNRLMYELRVQILLNSQKSIGTASDFAGMLIKTLYNLPNGVKLGKEITEIIKNMYEDELLKNEATPKIPNEFGRFVHYLIEKGVTDPNVRLFQGVFENNTEIVQKALDNGADTKCTDLMIIDRYRSDYDEFLKSNNK